VVGYGDIVILAFCLAGGIHRNRMTQFLTRLVDIIWRPIQYVNPTCHFI